MIKDKFGLKKQKGISVFIILFSLVAFMINSHTAWAFLFFAGLVWFVIVRIQE